VDQDGQLLTLTGQMPIRQDLVTTYPEYFAANPQYTEFAELAARPVEVPNVPNSVEIWQTFRDSWTNSVIFGKTDIQQSLTDTAAKDHTLAEPPRRRRPPARWPRRQPPPGRAAPSTEFRCGSASSAGSR